MEANGLGEWTEHYAKRLRRRRWRLINILTHSISLRSRREFLEGSSDKLLLRLSSSSIYCVGPKNRVFEECFLVYRSRRSVLRGFNAGNTHILGNGTYSAHALQINQDKKTEIEQ